MTHPADWYPDPSDPRQMRWFDGTTWTEHVAPATQQAQQPQVAAMPSGPANSPLLPAGNPEQMTTGQMPSERAHKSNAGKRKGSKPPKGWLIAGVIFLVLGISSCGVGTVISASFASSLTELLSGASTVALSETTRLDATTSTGVVVSSSVPGPGGPVEAAVSCEGEDENGNQIFFNEPSAGTTGTVTSGEDTLVFVYSFDTSPGMSYTVVCTGTEFGEGKYAVASFPGVGKVVVGLSGIVSGFNFMFLGTIFLIVGLVKRSKWKNKRA
jgi:hypothetical protein